MRNGRNKTLIIILIVVAILAILGGVFAYLFFATDIFRTGQELFAKYLTQNIEVIKEISKMEKIEQLENKLKQSKYEENIEILFSEKDAEPAVEITLDTQKDSISGKLYSILGLWFEGAEKLEIEYMQENDNYSLRFTNAVKQFLTIQNNDLKKLAEKLGMEETDLEEIPDKIDFKEFSFEDLKITENEINSEVGKYAGLLYNNIAKEKYQKNKDVVITVNGKTITTNSYVLTLSAQDVKTLLIKVLETLKQDEIILGKLQKIDEKISEYEIDSIKESFQEGIQEEIDSLKEEIVEELNFIITVYEQNKETVRIKLEQDLEYITLDTIKEESKKQIDLNYTTIEEDNTQFSNKISFVKENNKMDISFSNTEGEEQHISNLLIQVNETGNKTEIVTTLDLETIEISINRFVEIVNEIEYDVTLDKSNNIVLNKLSSAQLANIFTQVAEKLNTEYIEPIEMLVMLFALSSDSEETEVNDVEIFNQQFTSYEGTEIDVQEITTLIAIVKNHNDSQIISETPRYVTVTGDIEFGVDSDSILWPEGDWNYTVECLYQDEYVSQIKILKNAEIQDNKN